MFGFGKKREAHKLKYQNVLIIGAGEVGTQIAKRLSRDQYIVTVIDSNPYKLENVQNNLDVQTVLGSGASPKILEEAGIATADVCIAATNDDEINVLASIYASVLNPQITRLARVREYEYSDYMHKLDEQNIGIQLIVNPEEAVVRMIDRLLSLPQALDYAEFAQGQVRMVCYKIEEGAIIGSPLMMFKSLIESNDILVAAIRRAGTLFIPSGDDIIEKDDVVYFVYKSSQQRHLLKALNKHDAFFSSACIVGGGNIGLMLAKLFEDRGLEVKLLEKNSERAKFLAAELNNSLVLLGDAREKEVLTAENIGKMDVFVAVSEDEETNILTCLLAKNLGVRDTVARVNKSSYVSLLSSIGIDHSVNPRIAAVNSFVNYIREGKVFASVSIGADEAEIIEVEFDENSSLLNKEIKDLDLPKGALILSILRKGIVIIPQGNTIIEPQDRIIVLGTHTALKHIYKN